MRSHIRGYKGMLFGALYYIFEPDTGTAACGEALNTKLYVLNPEP